MREEGELTNRPISLFHEDSFSNHKDRLVVTRIETHASSEVPLETIRESLNDSGEAQQRAVEQRETLPSPGAEIAPSENDKRVDLVDLDPTIEHMARIVATISMEPGSVDPGKEWEHLSSTPQSRRMQSPEGQIWTLDNVKKTLECWDITGNHSLRCSIPISVLLNMFDQPLSG